MPTEVVPPQNDISPLKAMKPFPISPGIEKANFLRFMAKGPTSRTPLAYQPLSNATDWEGRRDYCAVLQKEKVENIFMAAAEAWTFFGAQTERKQSAHEDKMGVEEGLNQASLPLSLLPKRNHVRGHLSPVFRCHR